MQTMLNVVVCCCVLLGVVPQSLKPVKLLGQQLPVPIFLLFRDRRCWTNVGSMLDPFSHLFQHSCCWPRTRITQGYNAFYKSLRPSHDALQIPSLLGVTASLCTPLPKRTQQCWKLLCPFASSFEKFHNNHCMQFTRNL